jgi:hypothetical protein
MHGQASEIQEYNRRIYWSLATVAGLSVVLLIIFVGFSFYRMQESIIYPQAALLSSHNLSALPHLLFQQRVSLRSQDTTPQVHGWYARNFGIGPEQAATGQCSLMWSEQTFFFLKRRMSLTICDSRNGRIIYIQQAMLLRH